MLINDLKSRIKMSHDISDDLWSDIVHKSKVMHLNKKEVLVQQGVKCKSIYYIVSGSFISYFISENGNKQAVWFYFDKSFDLISCNDSYFSDVYTKYEIMALEGSCVIKFDKKDMDYWAANSLAFNRFYISEIIKHYQTIFEARSNLITSTPVEFLNFIKKRHPIILKRIPSHYIAQFMGISQEWFCKIRKKRKNHELIYRPF